MKILIAGSRKFNDYDLFSEQLGVIIPELFAAGEGPLSFISGGATGADSMAAHYAWEHKIPIEVVYPEWDKHGKAAGVIRNGIMVDACDCAIIFWDGKSPGTKNTISRLAKADKPHRVVHTGD